MFACKEHTFNYKDTNRLGGKRVPHERSAEGSWDGYIGIEVDFRTKVVNRLKEVYFTMITSLLQKAERALSV